MVLFLLLITALLTRCKGDVNQGFVDVNDVDYHEATGISEISINVSSSDIQIIPEDRKDIKFELTGQKSSNFNHELKISKLDNTLVVKIIYLDNINIGRMDLLAISVPKEYQENIKVNASSADVNVEGLNLKRLGINLSLGDVDINNTNLEELVIEVTSGETGLSRVNAGYYSFNSSSGDLVDNEVITDSFEYDIKSGAIIYEKFQGDISGEGSSNDVKITYEIFNNNIDIKSTSGGVELDLPDDAEFYLTAEATSGDIHCDFPVSVRGKKNDDKLMGVVISDNNTINVSTFSGDITIK